MGGRTLRFRCRCSHEKCRARRTLRKHPDEYRVQPKCAMCGRRKWRLDVYRQKKEQRSGCECDGYHHPHAYGRGQCRYNRRFINEDLRILKNEEK